MSFPYRIDEQNALNGRVTIDFGQGNFRWTMFVLNSTAREHMRRLVDAGNVVSGIYAGVEYQPHPTEQNAGEFIVRMHRPHPFSNAGMVIARGPRLSEALRNLADEVERSGVDLTPIVMETPWA